MFARYFAKCTIQKRRRGVWRIGWGEGVGRGGCFVLFSFAAHNSEPNVWRRGRGVNCYFILCTVLK